MTYGGKAIVSRIIIHYKIMREMQKISLYLNSTWAHLSYRRTLKLISYGRAASPLLLRLHALRASPMVKHVFGAGVQCLIVHLHFHRWILSPPAWPPPIPVAPPVSQSRWELPPVHWLCWLLILIPRPDPPMRRLRWVLTPVAYPDPPTRRSGTSPLADVAASQRESKQCVG